LDLLLIGKFFPVTVLGYFQRAKSLNDMIAQYTSGSMTSVLFPLLSQVQRHTLRFQGIVLKLFGVLCFVVFLLVGSLYLFSEELVVLLFSDKWLPSAYFFKILVLSGFAYPLGAMLVNILSSRGRSKEFLQLEIYKKMIVATNLLLFIFYKSIEMYLYGLVAVSFLTVFLNILFAAKSIHIPLYHFLKPLVVQMGIAIVSVICVMVLTKVAVEDEIWKLVFKGVVYMMLYIAINWVLQTDSFKYIYLLKGKKK